MVTSIPFSMHGVPSRFGPYLEGKGINKKVNHGRPPLLVVVSWETNMAWWIQPSHPGNVFCPKPKTHI